MFGAGTVNMAGAVFERIAGDRWSWSASYVHTQTTNTPYPEAPLPYFPRQKIGLGLSWFAPERWVIRGQLVHRSERFAVETGQNRLAPDWDVSLKATWQDRSKRSLVELYANNLARDDNTRTVGLRLILRF